MAGADAASERPSMFEDIKWGKFLAWLIVGVVLMIVTLFAWHEIEEFLIKNDHFRIAEAEDLTGKSPDLTVEGVHYSSSSQIRHVFAEDYGRSLYLVPIQKRREELLGIDWVESATISKIWPNTVRVEIKERVPVAFVHLPPNSRDGTSRFALIDAEGYILRPRIAARFTLPVITGLKETEPLENRKARVRRVIGMLAALGGLAEQISEVNAADPNNLIVEEHVSNDVLQLMLGDDNYKSRLQNFLANYNEIKAKRPDAKTLDLRVDGMITAVGEERRGQ